MHEATDLYVTLHLFLGPVLIITIHMVWNLNFKRGKGKCVIDCPDCGSRQQQQGFYSLGVEATVFFNPNINLLLTFIPS